MTTPRVHARRPAVLTAVTAALGLLLLTFAPAASAHTKLLKSTPERDGTVSALSEVSLVFSEPVKMPKVLVRDASGTPRQTGTASAAGATVTQALPSGLAPGRYTVAYRVIAQDGHPLTEEFAFTLSGEPGAAGEAPGQSLPFDPGQAEKAAAVPPAAAAEAPADAKGAAEQVDSEEKGGLTWLFVVVGLLIGIGLGAAFTVFRKRSRPESEASSDAAVGGGERAAEGAEAAEAGATAGERGSSGGE